MTQEEILEYNKRCAEFTKPSYYDKRRKDYPFPFPVIEVVPAETIIGYGSAPEGEIKHYTGQPDLMKYHSDWNWIMTVVEAIEKLKLGDLDGLIIDKHGNLDKHLDCKVGIEIHTNSCNIYIQAKMRLVDNFIEIFSKNKKEAVVEAINKFLTWYNEQKVYESRV